MGSIIWLIIMIPVSVLFSGIGIYAWKRKKPMWFWSGSTVEEYEISDVPAYNRANGIMWLVFSAVFSPVFSVVSTVSLVSIILYSI